MARRLGASHAAALGLPAPVEDRLSTFCDDQRCQYTERQLRRILRLSTEGEHIKVFEELRTIVEGRTPRHSCGTGTTVIRDSPVGRGPPMPPVARMAMVHDAANQVHLAALCPASREVTAANHPQRQPPDL